MKARNSLNCNGSIRTLLILCSHLLGPRCELIAPAGSCLGRAGRTRQTPPGADISRKNLMLELVTIIGTPAPEGFTFLARLRNAGGNPVDVPVGVVELRSYAYFQARVLHVTGQLYWSSNFENRLSEVADSEWRAHVSFLLERSAATSAADNGAVKNRNPVVN